MRVVCCFLLTGILTVWLLEASAQDLKLDSRKVLFLDDAVVASMENVTRTIHPAEKSAQNPVLTATEPWEGEVVLVYGSVLREDDGTFRMWYYCPRGVAYAESDDGIAWRKPELDIAKHDGQATNLVIDKEAQAGAPGHILDFYELFGCSRTRASPILRNATRWVS